MSHSRREFFCGRTCAAHIDHDIDRRWRRWALRKLRPWRVSCARAHPLSGLRPASPGHCACVLVQTRVYAMGSCVHVCTGSRAGVPWGYRACASHTLGLGRGACAGRPGPPCRRYLGGEDQRRSSEPQRRTSKVETSTAEMCAQRAAAARPESRDIDDRNARAGERERGPQCNS